MKSHSSRKSIFLLFACLALMGTSTAQETQRVEIFGGYSLLHDSYTLFPPISVFHGWDGASTVFFNRWFGVTGDVSGHYGAETQIIAALPGTTAGKI